LSSLDLDSRYSPVEQRRFACIGTFDVAGALIEVVAQHHGQCVAEKLLTDICVITCQQGKLVVIVVAGKSYAATQHNPITRGLDAGAAERRPACDEPRRTILCDIAEFMAVKCP